IRSVSSPTPRKLPLLFIIQAGSPPLQIRRRARKSLKSKSSAINSSPPQNFSSTCSFAAATSPTTMLSSPANSPIFSPAAHSLRLNSSANNMSSTSSARPSSPSAAKNSPRLASPTPSKPANPSATSRVSQGDSDGNGRQAQTSLRI